MAMGVHPAVVNSLPIMSSQSSATMGSVLLDNTGGCNLRKRAKLSTGGGGGGLLLLPWFWTNIWIKAFCCWINWVSSGGKAIPGHVSEASEGLEKMRYKNRGGLKGKHYPYAHEAKAHNSLQSIKQRHTIDLATAKCSDYYIYMVDYYY